MLVLLAVVAALIDGGADAAVEKKAVHPDMVAQPFNPKDNDLGKMLVFVMACMSFSADCFGMCATHARVRRIVLGTIVWEESLPGLALLLTDRMGSSTRRAVVLFSCCKILLRCVGVGFFLCQVIPNS